MTVLNNTGVQLGVIVIMSVISRYCLFRKMGADVRQAFIPILGNMAFFDIAWDKRAGIAESLLCILCWFLFPDGRIIKAGMRGLACMILLGTVMVIHMISSVKTARSFHRSISFACGMFLLQPVFVLILALGKSSCHGKTLVRARSTEKEKRWRRERGTSAGRRYMIALYQWRSITALIACVITLFFSAYAIVWRFLFLANAGFEATYNYHFFTINSNTLTALAAGFIIPYAADGYRRKRFIYPQWLMRMHYAGTICTTLTMIFAVTIISKFDPVMAFGKYNFWLHIVCPIMVLISFFMVESEYYLSKNDALFCLIPFVLYSLVYIYKVVIVGQENGGWEDIYHLTMYIPVWLSFILMYFLAYGVASGIRMIHNKLLDFRHKQLMARWSEDADEVEIRIELFGLGRYMGRHEDPQRTSVPMDILALLAQKYNIRQEDLVRAYMRGFLDGVQERRKRHISYAARFYDLFGIPENDLQE